MHGTSLRFVLPVLVVLASQVSAEGNVLAFLDEEGALVVVGDQSANQVRVERTGELGQFRVAGLGTTTINGAALMGGDGTDTFIDPGDNGYLTVPPVITGFEVFDTSR